MLREIFAKDIDDIQTFVSIMKQMANHYSDLTVETIHELMGLNNDPHFYLIEARNPNYTGCLAYKWSRKLDKWTIMFGGIAGTISDESGTQVLFKANREFMESQGVKSVHSVFLSQGWNSSVMQHLADNGPNLWKRDGGANSPVADEKRELRKTERGQGFAAWEFKI